MINKNLNNNSGFKLPAGKLGANVILNDGYHGLIHLGCFDSKNKPYVYPYKTDSNFKIRTGIKFRIVSYF